MISVRPTVYSDFMRINVREEQAVFIKEGMQNYAKDVLLHCSSLTFETSDKILMIGSVLEIPEDRYYIFTIFDKDSGPYMLRLYRFARRLLEMYKGKEVEAHAVWNDIPGNRFLRMLGFKNVEYLPKFYASCDCIRYVKV